MLMSDSDALKLALASRQDAERKWREKTAAEAHAALAIQSSYRGLPARRQHRWRWW